MRSYEILPSLKEILQKLFRKDRVLYEQVIKKIDEIINAYDVEHYKNLRHDLKEFKSVHAGSFVLVFRFVKSEDRIIFVDFDHHDRIYKKRFFV